MSDNDNIIKILNGISQAVSNKFHGSREDDGKGDVQKIGLRREEEIPFTSKGIIDGFGVSISGNKLKLSYHSEISLKEVYGKKFEEKITDVMEQCITYLKKEYKKYTKKTLGLKMIDEPVINVEHMNRIRSWVTAACLYEVEGLEKNPKDETFENRMKDTEKYWNAFNKKKDNK